MFTKFGFIPLSIVVASATINNLHLQSESDHSLKKQMHLLLDIYFMQTRYQTNKEKFWPSEVAKVGDILKPQELGIEKFLKISLISGNEIEEQFARFDYKLTISDLKKLVISFKVVRIDDQKGEIWVTKQIQYENTLVNHSIGNKIFGFKSKISDEKDQEISIEKLMDKFHDQNTAHKQKNQVKSVKRVTL